MSDVPVRRAAAASSGSRAELRERMHALPLPLAQLVRRALNGKSAVERHHGAFYLAECTLKLAAAARVGLYLARALVPGSDLARKLEALVLPSLGHWCELLRELGDALDKRPDAALLPFAGAAAELARKRPEWTHVAELAHRIAALGVASEETVKQALRRGALGFFDLVVAYRNEVIGHGAQRSNAFYDELASLLLDAVVEVLSLPALFGDLSLAEARLELDGQTSRAVWYGLVGLAGLPRGDDAGDAVPGQLYFIGPPGSSERVPLHPLVVYRQEDELGREQVGFLNRTTRRKADGGDVIRSAEHLDYASGQAIEGIDVRAALTALLSRIKGRPATPEDLDDLTRATQAEAPKEPADADADAAPGAVIGDFELLGELGRGSMGVVYKARQRSLGRVVALKVLPPALAADATARGRFKKEIAALARCDHPNVVRILATGADDRHAYYAMEYVDGVDLARAESPPPVDKLAELFAGAADGLSHLHGNKILHRDLKPGNLMLTADGRRLVIMDLGLAKLGDESRALTSADVKILGTLRYMAPEQLQRRLVDVDARADVYGLGAALYELATGRPIHDGDTEQRLVQQVLNEDPIPPRRAAPSLRSDLATVIQKALARLPEHRYVSAKDLADDLRAVAADLPIRARPPGLVERARLAARRNRKAFVGAGALTVAAGAGLLFAYYQTRLEVRYYVNLVNHAGVYEGVGELRGFEGRSMTRKVMRRGGRVVAVECINGYGTITDCGTFGRAEYHYAEDGKVAYRVESTTTARFLAKFVYSYKGRVVQMLRQDRNDLPQPEVGDLVMYRFDLDERGFTRKVTYYNDRGSPRQNLGSYGHEEIADERGLQTKITFLGEDGAPLVSTEGFVRADSRYDASGNEVERSYFTEGGKPTANSSGSASRRQRFDERGNLVERVFIGLDGRPAAQKDGYALWRARFDEHGCQVEKNFYGPDERPVVSKLGFATLRSKCDDHGREIERSHFGAAGEPVVIREGFASYRMRYDAQGNEIERSFFGADGLPLPNAGGAAVVRTTYNEHGYAVEVGSFGVDGRPVIVKAGRAVVRYRYDDRDNEIEVAYFDAAGARIVAKDGCALFRVRYDDRGKEIERTCLGTDEAPRLSPGGWATIRTRVDERGKPVERSYFDAAGKPALLEGGYSIERATYDARDNESERRFFGAAGEPVLRKDGYAYFRARYDDFGKVIEKTYFDLHDKSVPLPGAP